MARITSALGTNMMSNFSKMHHDPKSCEACMLNRTREPIPKAAVGDISKTVYKYFGQRISLRTPLDLSLKLLAASSTRSASTITALRYYARA